MRRFLARLQPLGLLVMRIALGAVMIAHGYAKVFHGGFGHNTAVMVANMGFPAFLGYVVTYLEFVGGMLLVLGLFTRVVGLLMACEMLVAILKVHLSKGIGTAGGMDLPLVCFAIALALVFFGAGLTSVDHLIFGGGLKAQ